MVNKKIIKQTEKAFLLEVDGLFGVSQKWILKSQVRKDGWVEKWATPPLYPNIRLTEQQLKQLCPALKR